ncbi:hypothetical protein ACHAW6_009855 [Cyclotella cf. meneghiniana]
MTPHSKHYVIKCHLFWEHVHSCQINLLKADSCNQLRDIFPKGLPVPAFVHVHS